MMNIFNAIEVIDIGIEKEEMRRNFYSLVADKFEDKSMKDLFTRLRNWEGEHIKKFTEIRNTVVGSKDVPKVSKDVQEYIRALVSERLYKEVTGDNFERLVKTPLTAIYYSIGFEKDSILLFLELMRYMEPANKDKVQKLIDEEKQHIIFLANLKTNYEV